MKKKSIIILATVVVVCAIGLLASYVLSWPVNNDSTGGNIGKSSRFSRKTATERIDNMEELLRADENYKNSIILAYSVMHARAIQFGNLVDMSNKAAGDIPEFEGVLKEMNDQAPLFTNVANALIEAGNNLNTVVSGISCPDVTQSTINASLSYTTLQKQNYLANRFIDTTDKYIKKAEASDELMLVRDLWVDYQQMTASLEGDKKAAKALDKKGTLLTPEQALNAVKNFDTINQIGVINGEVLSSQFLRPEVVYEVFRNNIEIDQDVLAQMVLGKNPIIQPYNSEKVDQIIVSGMETNSDILAGATSAPAVIPHVDGMGGRRDSYQNALDNLLLNVDITNEMLGVHFPSYYRQNNTGEVSNLIGNMSDLCEQISMVIKQTAEGLVERLELQGSQSGNRPPRIDR